ncbi:MAG: LCP family protein [Candidatus Portnoybacteria bacterium]|nr:LCP family protein [Candidatus Portnoybacteria bacterium]
MIRFFLKVFLLSFTAIAFSWFLEGAAYTFHYSKAQDTIPAGELTLPRTGITLPGTQDANFLLLGMAGSSYPAPYLTDTIMVGRFDAARSRVTLVSIPRDLFVQIPGSKNVAKINSLYEIGRSFSPLEPEKFIKEKVEEMSGLPIRYYAVIDVAGLERLIDSLGGVELEVKKPIRDPFYPGPNYSYEPFYLEAGVHHLSGHDAVRFARSRYAPRGDFERIERQHQLLRSLKEALASRAFSLENVFSLFSDLNGHLFTNVSVKDLPCLLAAFFSLSNGEIETLTLDMGPEGLLKEGHAASGAYILTPKAGLENYEEIKKFFSRISD